MKKIEVTVSGVTLAGKTTICAAIDSALRQAGVTPTYTGPDHQAFLAVASDGMVLGQRLRSLASEGNLEVEIVEQQVSRDSLIKRDESA